MGSHAVPQQAGRKLSLLQYGCNIRITLTRVLGPINLVCRNTPAHVLQIQIHLMPPGPSPTLTLDKACDCRPDFSIISAESRKSTVDSNYGSPCYTSCNIAIINREQKRLTVFRQELYIPSLNTEPLFSAASIHFVNVVKPGNAVIHLFVKVRINRVAIINVL
jgi:hypothetical protein